MPFLDIFRSLFGFQNNNQEYVRPENPRQENNFRKPIWENDDDDEDDYNSDFRQHGGGIHFEIIGDPFKMSQHIESQIDNLMKQFWSGFSGQSGGFFSQFDNDQASQFALPPPPENSQPNKSLREQILQREFDAIEGHNSKENQMKADTDVDGKISREDLMKVWKNTQSESSIEPQNSISRFFSGASTSTQIISRSDGTFEKHQTFKDSDGNEKKVIRRQIGDKVHEIITNRDKNGIETKTENFLNMDENEIKSFDNKWKSGISEGPLTDFGNRSYFPWRQLFGPDPKL